jgi:hypothetical protein
VAKLLSTYEFNRLLDTDDPLRLAIRGHAALEALVNAGLRQALGDVEELPRPVSRASLPVRLAIAHGVGILTSEGAVGMEALGKLRNLLAHGDLEDEIPGQTLAKIADAMRPILYELHRDVRQGSPPMALRISLLALHLEIHESITAWRTIRESQAEALQREIEARHALLTPEYLRRLLEDTEDDSVEEESM